jgi:hypothetical protein
MQYTNPAMMKLSVPTANVAAVNPAILRDKGLPHPGE